MSRAPEPLPGPSDWSFELIDRYHDVIRRTAQSFGLDTYPNQLEVITAEQMMDAYASVGMPRRRTTSAATWALPTRS
jgi:stage V sporulation protein R